MCGPEARRRVAGIRGPSRFTAGETPTPVRVPPAGIGDSIPAFHRHNNAEVGNRRNHANTDFRTRPRPDTLRVCKSRARPGRPGAPKTGRGGGAWKKKELQQILGADLPGQGEDLVSGKIRLPSGEEVEKLRISQDREVDPETYVVGPGDVMQLYIWGEFDLSYMLQVDPVGNVIIPTIGAFEVSGMVLSDVREQILAVARNKYPGVDITMTLASMRFFTAYVTGAVLQEGSFTVHPTTRVSDMIERAGGFTDELRGTTFRDEVGGKQVTRVRQIVAQTTGRRSIKLIHPDGRVDLVDLDMFLSTGDIAHNPYVRMGDVVHVGYRDASVFIFGARQPGGGAGVQAR